MSDFKPLYSILAGMVGKRAAKKIIILVLLLYGVPPSEIHGKTGVCYETLRKYRKASEAGQIDVLFQDNVRRNVSELDAYAEEIERELEENPPKSLREAQERIFAVTGIKRSLARVCKWLQKRGLNLVQ